MDHASFDRLTRQLATTSTRRSGLGLALGAAGGALASLFLTDHPGAEGRGKKQNKGKNRTSAGRKRSNRGRLRHAPLP